ncbi:MAG: germination protein YpeB [Clostridiales bacterium]|nr:germination protein YpeB [Clostridiales bacterium]
MYITARRLGAEINDSVALVAQHKLDIRKITSAKPYGYRFRADENITHNSIEYPELIYDGPFSDGRKDEEYRYFTGAASVTLEEAKNIAIAALPDFGVKTVTSAGKSENEPLYELTLSGDKGEAYCSVSEHGGKVVNLTVSRELGNIVLGEESAKACAVGIAERLGYDVQPVWYLASGGVAYVNLAPVIDDVVLYTDLVKVKVALDNGDVLGVEAKNYCLNHCDRNVKLTMNRAAIPQMLDSRLQVRSVRGALIPLENGTSHLCYEVASEYKGIEYFVYLDAATGETVKIMRTVDSEQGTLVM